MSVFRIEKTKDFTIMSNHHFKNKNLSLKAKGLLSLMLSLPEDWDYTTRGLASICKDGVDSISTALKELEAEGYLARKRFRRKDGSLGRMEYVIYEHPVCKLSESDNHEPQKPQKVKPVTESPEQEKPKQDFPIQAKPTQLNTNISSTNRASTDITKDKTRLNARASYTETTKQAEKYRRIIEKNIRVESLALKYGTERVNEIMELMMEPFYSMSQDYYIGKKKYPKEAVRSKFLGITAHQMEQVFEQFDRTTKKVHNPKSYILTLLYNADIIDEIRKGYITPQKKHIEELSRNCTVE